jgi:hypothetical protein
MLIAFVHNQKAFLPEVNVYIDFFKSKGVKCEVVHPEGLKLLKPDAAWYFMGTNVRRLPGAIIIHEYTSASVKPFGVAKDSFKTLLNTKPDYRIFLNEYVRGAFSFTDKVPYGLRDMGVDKEWLDTPKSTVKKLNSFIYTGEWRDRNIEKLLDVFATGKMKGYKLLLVSKDYEDLKQTYQNYSNITFDGPVPYDEMPDHIRSAMFAINFIPDQRPYNRQTSTKLLEYAACKTNIVSTEYEWMRWFEKNYGGKYLFLKDDLSNFTPEIVENFEYGFPDLAEWTWQKQIERSGVVQFLARKFPELRSEW